MQDANFPKDFIRKSVESEREFLLEVSKFIHSHPEANFEEKESSRFLVETLRRRGFTVEYPYGNVDTAFRASIEGSKSSPHIAILAEFDALPVIMPDGTAKVVHACGHNLNCSAAIGALLALQSSTEALPGKVSVFGTPAEEGGGGKIAMLEAGAFRDVDVIMTVHGDQRDWYTVARACTASEQMHISFQGSPARNDYPRSYVNAYDAVVLFMNALHVLDYRLTPDSLIQRRVVSSERAVNTIPMVAAVDVQIRSADEVFLQAMKEQVHAAADGAASAVGAKVEISGKGYRYERIIENKTLEQVARSNVEHFGHVFTYDEPSPYPFGTDTGNLSHRFPTIQFLIGRPEGFAFHTPQAVEQSISDSAQEMMINSAKILAATTLDLLIDPRLVDSAKEELEQYSKNGFEGTYSWHKRI